MSANEDLLFEQIAELKEELRIKNNLLFRYKEMSETIFTALHFETGESEQLKNV